MSRLPESVRKQVRERAKDRCEYCRIPQYAVKSDHHCDHILSIKQDGSDDLDNLALACLQCNTHKGSDIAGYDKVTGELTPLFNPRIQQWEDHFELQDFEIIGTTSIGRVTVRILKMNQPPQVKLRRQLILRGEW